MQGRKREGAADDMPSKKLKVSPGRSTEHLVDKKTAAEIAAARAREIAAKLHLEERVPQINLNIIDPTCFIL
jgi:hypothetical protein